jgi:hypothetical protein
MAKPFEFKEGWNLDLLYSNRERLKSDIVGYNICMNNGNPKFVIIPDEFLEKINRDNVVISASPITCVDNLPSGKIKSLYLIGEFNNSVDNLPIGIEKLYLGDTFNQSVDLIPISVKFLSLGSKFNQPLNNLPPGLETLELETYKYKHPLSFLPASCKTVIQRGVFRRHLNDLPDTVENIIIHITYGWIEDYAMDFRPPTGLKNIIIYHPSRYNYHTIPGCGNYLEYDSIDKYKYEIIKNKIPKSVNFEIIKQHI